MKRCLKCVLSENFPKITFDARGICNFCNDESFYSTEEKQILKARVEIRKMFDENRGKHEYDAILCYSGGKDSTYTLMLAIMKYNLKVLSFTLDNGFISDTAFKNIEKVVRNLGVDHITYKPSYKFMKDLFRISSIENIYNPKSLTRVSSNCNSCISLLNITALRYALEKDIPFILAGFTLGQIPLNSIFFINNYEFLKESRKPVLDKLRQHLGNDVSRYLEIAELLLNRSDSFPYQVSLLAIENIPDNKIIENISTLGWEEPEDVDGCSTNCRINTFNNHLHEKKFGYNPYELELSHLIRKNLLTREIALSRLLDQPVSQIDSIYKELMIDQSAGM
jgi:hypothetical protein